MIGFESLTRDDPFGSPAPNSPPRTAFWLGSRVRLPPSLFPSSEEPLFPPTPRALEPSIPGSPAAAAVQPEPFHPPRLALRAFTTPSSLSSLPVKALFSRTEADTLSTKALNLARSTLCSNMY